VVSRRSKQATGDGRMADPVNARRISPRGGPEKVATRGLKRVVWEEREGLKYGGDDLSVVRIRGKKMHPLRGIRHHIS